MNNHTASVLLFVAVFGSSLLMNVPVVTKRVDNTPKAVQPLGKGFIKISDTADNHTAISDTTDDRATEAVSVEETPTVTNKKQKSFNATITHNMLKVRAIAKEFGHHETMQAILLQESNGGTAHPVGNLNSPIGKRSYGIMQVQLVAGRSVLSRNPSLVDRYFPNRKLSSITDEEIIALLLKNDEANIRIAVHHFDIYMSIAKGDWMKAVAAYNMGIGNALKRSTVNDVPYVKSIQSRIHSTVRPFNKSNPGTLTL